MAELPGWNRDRLMTADPADVAAARLLVYVRQFKSFLTKDIKAEIEDITVADQAAKNPKQAEAHEHKRRLAAIQDLKEAATLQAALRERLGLEPLRG